MGIPLGLYMGGKSAIIPRRMKLSKEFIIVNALTFGRVPFVFLFLGLACWHVYVFGVKPWADWVAWAALASLILASVTDLFDGLLARRWKVESQFGAMADPLMDKVFYLVVFPVFTWLLPIFHPEAKTHAVLMMLITVSYMLRDQWVTFLRAIGALYQQDARANWLGKFRTAYSFPFACIAYVHIAIHSVSLPVEFVYVLEAVALFVNFWSMGTYTKAYWPSLRKSMRLED